MAEEDPVGQLVLLCRAAAEAGEDWQLRLRRDWLPRVVAATSRPVLVAALVDWSDQTSELGADLTAQIEAAVVSAMAEQGYT